MYVFFKKKFLRVVPTLPQAPSIFLGSLMYTIFLGVHGSSIFFIVYICILSSFTQTVEYKNNKIAYK
jgi:uncharacterized protein YqgC (DUF456 family)